MERAMDDFFEVDIFDSDSDYFEDQAEEAGLFNDDESLNDIPASDRPVHDDHFDLVDILTIGTILGGQAYDHKILECRQRALIQEEQKKKKE